MNYALSELDRQVSGMILAGYVSAVQLKPPRVRVTSDDWESRWVPWFAFAAGKARHWRPPSVGEQAVLTTRPSIPAMVVATSPPGCTRTARYGSTITLPAARWSRCLPAVESTLSAVLHPSG